MSDTFHPDPLRFLHGSHLRECREEPDARLTLANERAFLALSHARQRWGEPVRAAGEGVATSGSRSDSGVTGTMTSACGAGALGAAALASKVPQRMLGRGFAALVTAVAAYLLVSAAFLGGPPGTS
jgi:hypothetical protein